MSIKSIEEIPLNPKESCRDRIRADIKEAIDKRISVFEFVGYENTKGLAEAVRSTVSKYFSREYYNSFRKAREKVKEDYEEGTYISYISSTDYIKRFITINARTINKEKHVYATIDFDFLDNIESILEKDIRERTDKKIKQSKLKGEQNECL